MKLITKCLQSYITSRRSKNLSQHFVLKPSQCKTKFHTHTDNKKCYNVSHILILKFLDIKHKKIKYSQVNTAVTESVFIQRLL
jgi:hypothetical protein